MPQVNSETQVCVIGAGYVGLPLIQALGKKLKVTGLDINGQLIEQLERTNENPNINFTGSPEAIKEADFVILCLPTPVTEFKNPDLTILNEVAHILSYSIKHGATIILESTVYPGFTEEELIPIIEESGLKAGIDFKVGYSPERINPGDDEHGVDKVTKVVAGMDAETTEAVAALYQLVTPNVFTAANIKTAEAAKVIENTQRDLNIALMNELAMLFNHMGLDTSQVLDAAATKWNFNRYSPGLVGGHCIPVDPYYLVYKAKELGFHPQVITAGRAVNDGMPKYVSELAVKALNQAGKAIKGSKIVIMGLTYKENVPDLRETPVRGIIQELTLYKASIFGYDPLLTKDKIEKTFAIPALMCAEQIETIKPDCLIITVTHDAFSKWTIDDLANMTNSKPVLVDVRRLFGKTSAEKAGFIYKTL